MKTSKHTFFCEQIDELLLSKEESHHAIKVLRLNSGNLINLIDGKGQFAIAEITNYSKNEVNYKIIEKHIQPVPDCKIHIAIAPTKSNERIEFFIEKAVEIGISEITPILASNSERKQIKIERWQKIIVSAAKQSNNLYFPKLNPLTKIDTFYQQVKESNDDKFIAHCENDNEKIELKNRITANNKICILIGPEGDFTNQEIEQAKSSNFTPVSLGKSRLRTETAGIIACHTIHLKH